MGAASAANGFVDPTAPGYRALRKGRVSLANQVYLITTVTRDRFPRFSEWAAAAEASRVTVDASVLGQSRFLAWILMPDHFHGLLCLAEGADLGNVVRLFKGNVARRVNRATAMRGSLWESGFHDHAVRREEDLRAIARYVIANPVRAGLVKRAGDYPFWNAEWL